MLIDNVGLHRIFGLPVRERGLGSDVRGGGYWVTPFLGKERKTGCPWRVRSWRKAGGRKNGKW